LDCKNCRQGENGSGEHTSIIFGGYPASEKLEIIRLVEQSHLPVRRTLATLGILPGTFYRWYERLQSGGV
jgi:transposase-like protein